MAALEVVNLAELEVVHHAPPAPPLPPVGAAAPEVVRRRFLLLTRFSSHGREKNSIFLPGKLGFSRENYAGESTRERREIERGFFFFFWFLSVEAQESVIYWGKKETVWIYSKGGIFP